MVNPLRHFVIVLAVVTWLGSVQLQAQTGTTAPAYEVASIHPSDPKSTGARMQLMPGGLSISGMTIKNLIWLAYGIHDYQLSGSPKWLDSEKYDIQAKPPANTTFSRGQRGMDEQKLRIRALLADRFQLRVHRETKISPVYSLTVAKTGLRMQEAKGTDPGSNDKGTILPWTAFLTVLSRLLDRPVIDKTGLTGTWCVKLQYTSDDGQPLGLGVQIDPTQSAPGQGPSIFTALQEQLGLKAESAKGPVDTLVIDSVARPTAN
jgi:uncharacterized protein (TIGR03435 family)